MWPGGSRVPEQPTTIDGRERPTPSAPTVPPARPATTGGAVRPSTLTLRPQRPLREGQHGFVEQQPGPASKLEVQVTEGVVTHEVTVGQVQRWLALGSSNPNEEAKRKRLREVFTAK